MIESLIAAILAATLYTLTGCSVSTDFSRTVQNYGDYSPSEYERHGADLGSAPDLFRSVHPGVSDPGLDILDHDYRD